jgi:SAM-dependent methyltransferase
MKYVSTRYLDNGVGYNFGQAATLIEIERDSDYDDLLEYIVRSDYYGTAYTPRQSGQIDDRLTGHFWWVAEMAALLGPRRVIEIGCARGDVLRILAEHHGVDVVGVDFGTAFPERLWPVLRPTFRGGEIFDVLRSWSHGPYDLACAFDIWEHLHPRVLGEAVDLLIKHSSEDALFLFVIPAFGRDEVFGEPFPLEFEENRAAFEAREPFRFFVTDAADPKVPAAGHLTWAHTDWWTRLFEARGLVRVPAVERGIHRLVDPHVPHSIRSFYVFRRHTPSAERRVSALRVPEAPGWFALRSLWNRRGYQRRFGAGFDVLLRTEIERWSDGRGPVLRSVGKAARRLIQAVRP